MDAKKEAMWRAAFETWYAKVWYAGVEGNMPRRANGMYQSKEHELAWVAYRHGREDEWKWVSQSIGVEATHQCRSCHHSYRPVGENEDCPKCGSDGTEPGAAVVYCQCGARAANECPGAWERGCDLGSNEDHVEVAPVADEDALARALRER